MMLILIVLFAAMCIFGIRILHNLCFTHDKYTTVIIRSVRGSHFTDRIMFGGYIFIITAILAESLDEFFQKSIPSRL